MTNVGGVTNTSIFSNIGGSITQAYEKHLHYILAFTDENSNEMNS